MKPDTHSDICSDIQVLTQHEYTVRKVRRGGRNYMVVPVIMMVNGVHNGSHGPILHLQENFGQNPQDWNGVPLTAGHPTNNDGDYVSVNAVNHDQWVVGHLENARVENGRLKADAWIDEQLAIAVNPEVVNYLNEGKKLEVSTGAITQDINETGEYEGERYQAVTLSYIPDHLALLPGEQGACSWSDGCGIRNNKRTKEEQNEMGINDKYITELKEATRKGVGVVNGLQTNAQGFLELSRTIQTRLDRLDSESRVHFLSEVYEDYFVYEQRDRDRGDSRFYQQSFSNQENNEVEFVDDPLQVRRKVEYVPVTQNNTENKKDCGCAMRRTRYNQKPEQEEDDNMSETNKAPSGEVMDMVSALIVNERTQFNKVDRAWLLQLNEDQLKKLEPKDAAPVAPTREEAIQVLAEDLSDITKLKEILPSATSEKLDIGLKAYEDTRAALVKAIQSNTSKEDWPAEKLDAMDNDTLQRLEKSVRKTDYSGQGSVTTYASNGEVEPMLPAGLNV